MTTDNEKVLNDLAKQFALDYYSMSSILSNPESEIRYAKEIFQEHFYDDVFVNTSGNTISRLPKVRNIFVLGAGASYDSYKDILLAGDAVDKIKQKLDFESLFGNQYFKEKVNEEREKIEKLYKLNPEDFESQLAILSNYFKIDDLRDQLASIYNKKHYPSLFYEILAHIFKHRFIDVIINFNFDELLDNAIEEELNSDDYHSIFSDGQCSPLTELLVSERLKLPIYIKPHGTISHPSSMKFTKNDYFGLSPSMKNQLSEILSGKIGGGTHLGRVNLIVVGFGMKSFEFNQLLKELPENSAIYYFSPDEPDLEFFNKEDPSLGQDITKFSKFEDGKFRWVQLQKDKSDHNQLGQILKKLYDESLRKKIFKPTYEPKDIYRHELITELFYDTVRGKRRTDFIEREGTEPINGEHNERGYFEARMYVEFIIALCKSKGKIRLIELLHERFGYYFDLYFKKSIKLGFQPISIEELINKFNITVEDYDKSKRLISLRERKNPEEMINMLLSSLNEILRFVAHFTDLKKYIEKDSNIVSVKRLLKKIYEHDTNSISPKFQDKRLYLYKGVEEKYIINTKLSLITNFVIKDIRNWDLLLISSQKGKILLNLLINESLQKREAAKQGELFKTYDDKVCCLLLEDDLYATVIEEHLRKERLIDGEIKIARNSTNDNNSNNVILFLKRDETKDKGWRPLKAIVYQKINDSNKINPLIIMNALDLESLINDFFDNYFERNKSLNYKDVLLDFGKSFDRKKKRNELNRQENGVS
jgi:SIR2-like domain